MRVQGTMLDMMRDVNTGIRWILHHTHFHGGDPNQVYLVGQSCGAQLAAMALITQVDNARVPSLLLHVALQEHTSRSTVFRALISCFHGMLMQLS